MFISPHLRTPGGGDRSEFSGRKSTFDPVQKLFNGTTGAPIGSTIAGDAVNDSLGSGGVTALANNNFVIVSPNDDVGGAAAAGSVKLFNGTTGAPIGSTIAGSFAGDVSLATVTGSATGDFYVLGLSRANNNGLVDSGLVRLIAQ
jgi:hypothetical protein